MPGAPTRTWNSTLRLTVEAQSWMVRLGMSVGLAGFLALMGVLSFPVPWTPVPFSMMPLGLLMAGAYQRPGYAALSVGIYLLAGALGAPIYAEGASGWSHLIGPTAGYLFGFAVAASLVAWYVRAPRRMLGARTAAALLVAVGASLLAGVAAIAWMWGTGDGFSAAGAQTAGWGVGRSTLWALLFLIVGAGVVTSWLLARRRGDGRPTLNLFLVMLASLIALHACGVTVLWLATDYTLMAAITLGSIVFLPFDIIKAGLAVAASLPFLPPLEDPHA